MKMRRGETESGRSGNREKAYLENSPFEGGQGDVKMINSIL
jgi:hypothetical protein